MKSSAGTLAVGVQANNRQRYVVPLYRLSITRLGTMFDCWALPRWRETRLFGKVQPRLVHDFLPAVRPVLLGL